MFTMLNEQPTSSRRVEHLAPLVAWPRKTLPPQGVDVPASLRDRYGMPQLSWTKPRRPRFVTGVTPVFDRRHFLSVTNVRILSAWGHRPSGKIGELEYKSPGSSRGLPTAGRRAAGPPAPSEQLECGKSDCFMREDHPPGTCPAGLRRCRALPARLVDASGLGMFTNHED
jgi:hypothetical protein